MTLPNFLIIGAMKSGTSSLHQALKMHPQVFMPARKELHFFTEPNLPWTQISRYPANSISDNPILKLYSQFFRDRQPLEIAIGEATTTYLTDPQVAQRIHSVLPNTRLICVLRNPVDRAYSHFHHQLRRGEETCLSFEAAMSNQNCLAGYRNFGLYAQHLQPYFKYFPREHIKIILFEDLVQDPEEILNQLFLFLELSPAQSVPFPHTNPGWAPAVPKLNQYLIAKNPAIPLFQFFLPRGAQRIKRLPPRIRQFIMKRIGSRAIPPLSPNARARIFEFFRDDISQLETLLQRDLSQWMPSEQ